MPLIYSIYFFSFIFPVMRQAFIFNQCIVNVRCAHTLHTVFMRWNLNQMENDKTRNWNEKQTTVRLLVSSMQWNCNERCHLRLRFPSNISLQLVLLENHQSNIEIMQWSVSVKRNSSNQSMTNDRRSRRIQWTLCRSASDCKIFLIDSN